MRDCRHFAHGLAGEHPAQSERYTPTMNSSLIRWGALLMVSVAMGCAGNSKSESAATPVQVMQDQKAHTAAQIKAVRAAWEEVRAGRIDAVEMREQLKKVAWARGRYYEVRIAALEEILADETNITDTRNMMRLMLPTETNWNVIGFLGDTAAERGWTDLTTALVRCWARPVDEPTDDQRPERRAIERLHPGRPAQDIVFGVFAGDPALSPAERGMADSREREQQDAWALLRRLDKTGERTVALLAQPGDAGEDPTLGTLRAAARELGVIPDSPEQVAWVTRLRTEPYAAAWSQCAAAVAQLDAEQRRGLALRHIMGVRWAAASRPAWMRSSTNDLLSTLDSTLEGRKKHLRAEAATAGNRQPESLRTWRDKMCWGDALLCTIAAEAAEDAGLASVLLAQSEDDRRDTSTEYGGVIDGAASGYTVRLFEPRPAQRVGDRRFIAPPEMVDQGVDSIFHYHLHCTSADNADYAGPSADDIAYAKRQGRACLVFTCVSRESMNVDYYQGDGVVIDLGTMRK